MLPFKKTGEIETKKNTNHQPHEAKGPNLLSPWRSANLRISVCQMLTSCWQLWLTMLPTQWGKKSFSIALRDMKIEFCWQNFPDVAQSLHHAVAWEPTDRVRVLAEFSTSQCVHIKLASLSSQRLLYHSIGSHTPMALLLATMMVFRDFFEEISGASITTGVEDVGPLGIAMTNLMATWGLSSKSFKQKGAKTKHTNFSPISTAIMSFADGLFENLLSILAGGSESILCFKSLTCILWQKDAKCEQSSRLKWVLRIRVQWWDLSRLRHLCETQIAKTRVPALYHLKPQEPQTSRVKANKYSNFFSNAKYPWLSLSYVFRYRLMCKAAKDKHSQNQIIADQFASFIWGTALSRKSIALAANFNRPIQPEPLIRRCSSGRVSKCQ